MNHLTLCTVGACSLVAATLVHGQATGRDSVTLPVVVVTANRMPVPLSRVSSTVTVLDVAQLRRQGVTHVLDALRRVPGLAVVRSGSFGGQTSLFTRGGESDYTKVLIDGVPMNDPGGSIDIGALTLDEIERIEIVRGPASVVHGSDAVSGVIQLVTRRAGPRPEGRITAGGGSYGSSWFDAGGSAAAGPLGVAAGIARHATDGTLPYNNRYENTVISGRAALTGSIPAFVTVRHSDNGFHYPTDGAGRVVDRNAHRHEARTSAGLEVSTALGARVTARVAASLLGTTGRTTDAPDGPADTLGLYTYRSRGTVRRREVSSVLQFQAARAHALVLGTEWSGERQRLADSSNFATELQRFSADRGTAAGFLQLLGGASRWAYAVGGRVDRNDVFGTFRTARATGAVNLTHATRLRGGIGNSFKAPTFFEQFSTAFSVGNPDLLPERATSWELAVEHRTDRLEASAIWFSQRFRDLIQYTFISPTDPSYFNVAAARAAGLELELNVRATSATSLRASGTLLRTRVDDTGFDSGPGATFVHGARLLRRPSSTFALGSTTRFGERTTLDLLAMRVGARDDRDFASFPATPVVLDAYTRVDIGTQVRLTRPSAASAIMLMVRADNAFGAGYQEIANFDAPRRILFVGLRAEWGR
ncbi:MAG: TonB-dependent receptor plug domain-containing protein [Gemmatimonadaceae bacterium]